MTGRYIKQPRVGVRLLTGRYGVVEVLSVHAHGLRLLVRDEFGQDWPVERAPAGVWVEAPSPSSVDEGNPDR